MLSIQLPQSMTNLNGGTNNAQQGGNVPISSGMGSASRLSLGNSMPDLAQTTQINTARGPPPQGQQTQNRMVRNAQIDEEFQPDYHSNDDQENYQG